VPKTDFYGIGTTAISSADSVSYPSPNLCYIDIQIARFEMTKLKAPNYGAVAKMREVYKKLREQPLSPEQKNELREVFKKRDRQIEKTPKKIAKRNSDMDMP